MQYGTCMQFICCSQLRSFIERVVFCQDNNVRIHIPPPSVQKDEIVVTGEKDGVAAAVQKIKTIYHRKVSKS